MISHTGKLRGECKGKRQVAGWRSTETMRGIPEAIMWSVRTLIMGHLGLAGQARRRQRARCNRKLCWLLLQKLTNDIYFQMGNVCQGLFVCSYSLPEFGCWLLQNRETVKWPMSFSNGECYAMDILYDFTLCYRGLLFVITEQWNSQMIFLILKWGMTICISVSWLWISFKSIWTLISGKVVRCTLYIYNWSVVASRTFL